jgi:small-conductance mechanosensitive channel
MQFSLKRRHPRWRPWLVLLVSTVLLGVVSFIPAGDAMASEGADGRVETAGQEIRSAPISAPIEVDGLQLFRLWSSRDFSADQRVDLPNRLLSQAVQARYPVRVAVVEKNNLPVITLNGQPLLTVTGKDAPEGIDKEQQAEIWRTQIERAIDRGRREREPSYVRSRLLQAGLYLLLAFLLQRALGVLWRNLSGAGKPSPPEAEGKPIRGQGVRLLLNASLRLAQVAIWVAALISISRLFPVTRMGAQRLVNAMGQSLASPVLPLGERSYSVLDAIVLLLLFIVLIKLVGVVQKVLRNRVLQFTGFGAGGQEAIAFIVQFVLLFFGSLVLLQLWGLDLSSLTLFASVLGVGVGLGLQGITKNFISGMIIIFEQPIQVGDFVEVGDLQGTVRRVSLRSTEVVTLDRISIIVPNSEFLESRVINWSHGSPVSRLQIPVGVAYGSDCTVVRKALIDACNDYEGILSTPSPRVFFDGFGDSSLDFILLVWINQPMRQYEIRSDLNFRIEAILRLRNITIPFPQRDLHFKNDSLQLSLSPELETALGNAIARVQPQTGQQ